MSLHSLMFGWEFPPHCEGGLGVACEGLVRGLLMHGTRVTLVLPSDDAVQMDGLAIRHAGTDTTGIVRAVPSALRPYDTQESYTARQQASAEGMRSLYGADLAQAVEQYTEKSIRLTQDVDADVVHCHDWMTYEAGARVARQRNVPLVTHVHATEYDRTDCHPDPWIAQKERSGLIQATRIVAVSDYTKRMLVRQYGICPSHITVVHNGMNYTATHQPIQARQSTSTPLVLFLGRLTVQKNPRMFLDAAKIVHEVQPNVQFVLAGDGPMLQELIDHACKLGLADSVIFTGKVPRSDVDALYRNASCFVMPSLSEPFGLVALEAIAHGVPLVLSKQSGAAEVIEHAFKVDFWDVERFADCIITVLREEPLATQLRSEAPRILQRLSWQNQAAEIRSLYRNVLTKRPRTFSPTF